VGDASALAENILRLLKDSNLSSRLAASAYEECNRYDWNAVREQWLSVYRALMSDSKTGVNPVRT
jgi:glycosyltransferase involved in cell wall biosynthesis